MSFREKAQIVVVSVAIALALAAGFYYLAPGFPGGSRGGADDAPILIAGGSLYLGTDLPAIFTPADKKTLVYSAGYKVYGIEATDKDDNTVPYTLDKDSGTATITISYCKNSSCNDKDEVTMDVNNSSDPAITIKNSAENIGKAPRLLPNLWVHARRHGKIEVVKLIVNKMTKPDVKCDESECNIVVQTEK